MTSIIFPFQLHLYIRVQFSPHLQRLAHEQCSSLHRRLLPAGSQQSEIGELENTPEAVEIWAAGLAQRFGGRPIAVCLEQSRGALVYMLTKYPHLVLFPVHPTTAARYLETFAPSGAKSDPSDTAFLLDLLL